MKYLPLFLLAACASAPTKEPSGNELALREFYPGRWSVLCRDQKAGYGEAPFLRFTIIDADRIADLHFVYGPVPRYDEHRIPPDLYGPFHGEEVTDRSSTYLGANEYEITDTFHLFLPPLKTDFEKVGIGRDRDLSSQNGAVEVAVNGQRYASIIHLRCMRVSGKGN